MLNDSIFDFKTELNKLGDKYIILEGTSGKLMFDDSEFDINDINIRIHDDIHVTLE